MAYPTSHLLALDMPACTAVIYVGTNVLGLAMMALGLRIAAKKVTWRISIPRAVFGGVVYAAVAVIATKVLQDVFGVF